jgi:hypothetical protein
MISFDLPIKTVSEANCTEHWSVKAKRHRQQQLFIRLAYSRYLSHLLIDTAQGEPCYQIKMIRIAPRKLDDDNLVSAFKWIRDELSELLIPEKALEYIDKKGKTKKLKGRADSDERILWKYDQLINSPYAVRIEVTLIRRTLAQTAFPLSCNASDPAFVPEPEET